MTANEEKTVEKEVGHEEDDAPKVDNVGIEEK